MQTDLTPGTVVMGPFQTTPTDDYVRGIGVVQKRGKRYPYNVGEGFVPVRIIVGDRCSGGYRPEALVALPELKLA